MTNPALWLPIIIESQMEYTTVLLVQMLLIVAVLLLLLVVVIAYVSNDHDQYAGY